MVDDEKEKRLRAVKSLRLSTALKAFLFQMKQMYSSVNGLTEKSLTNN